MKQTAKLGCRVFVALLCLAMLASVITVPTFAAGNSALTSVAGQDLSAFIDLINKYNEVKDQPDAADQLKDYVDEQYATNESFKESADEILGVKDEEDAKQKFDTVIDDVLVNEEHVGDIDTVVDAVQNGASFDEIKDAIEYQKEEQKKKDEDPTYVSPTCTVLWKVDGVTVHEETLGYKKLIPTVAGNAVAGEYIKWNNEYVIVPEGATEIVITGHKVDIVDKIVTEVNGLAMNYGEYEIVYENGVATLYVNVDASNYKQIILDVLGDVREGGVKSAYKQAVTSFIKASATEIYNGKVNTVTVNGYEVVAVEGYGISQLVDLLDTVEAGNYGEIISAAGLKNALLVDPVTPTDIAEMGDDGLLATYDVVLGAEDKADSAVTLNVALRGDLDLVRKGAKAILAAGDFVLSTGGDLDVEIFVPAAFSKYLAKALNYAGVSDETKQTLVAGMSECATVGELLALFDLLDYEQFVNVVEYLLDHVPAENEHEQALLDKIEEIRPALALTKKLGNILIDKVPESVSGKEASVTFKSIYNLTQMVTYEDLADLTQLKDADALVGSTRLNDVVARVANKLNVNSDRAQDIVMSMVEAFADYQNRIPDSAKAQKAFDYVNRAIDLVYNKIPEKFADAKLTDTYKGDGKFSFSFSKTYNPTAWLKNILDEVSITVFGKTIVLGNYIPSRDITSDVSITVNISDLYSVTYMDGDKVVFQGFLPYGAELAPYGKDAIQTGHSVVWVDQYGEELTTMPGADTVLYAKHVADKHTITFKVLDQVYVREFAYGTVPALEDELYLFSTLNFKGWAGVEGELPVVTGDATYEAVYTATITFKVLKDTYTVEVNYGEIPALDAGLTAKSTLNFKGWKNFEKGLPAAVAHATYEASYTANVNFYVEGELFHSAEVAYNETPVVATPTKPIDMDYSYSFNSWTVNGVAVVLGPVTAHTDYYGTFTAKAHFGEDSNVVREGNTYVITLGDYVVVDNRLTASTVIPSVIFEIAAMNDEISLKAVIDGDTDVKGAHAVSILLDNLALLNIEANATEEEITFAVSSLIDAEADCPLYGDYYAVYSFDLIGSAFDGANGGKATVTVPFEENAAKFHGYIYYLVGETAEKLAATESAGKLTFTTSHFSYYAVNYEQFLFNIKFFDVNGDLIKELTLNSDNGETLLDSHVPAFTAVADSDAAGHYVAYWYFGSRMNVNPVKQFEQAARDYEFHEMHECVAHTFGAYECIDDATHKRVCSICGYEEIEAHTYVDGECVCGHTETEVTTPEETTPEETTPEVTTPEETTPEETTPEEVTTPEESTTPEETTPEETTPEETTPEVTTPAESESETEPTEEKGNKNGWWIFLIVLLVIIAILIIAYILYGHNIFPKGPAAEEQTEETPKEQEELTDAQIAAQLQANAEAGVPLEEIHIVDHVAADEVDGMMTDAQAVSSVVLVASTASGKMGAVNVGTLNDHFETGDKVDIEVLKEKKLIDADCKRVKILADGDLDKALTVEANSFSLQAIKMITLTGGHAIKLQANAPAEAPVEEAPAQEAVAEEGIVDETVAEETVEETTAEETTAEETVEETTAEETVEEAPVEETAEEAPVEETVEETPVEETVEETPAQEAAEEAPEEENPTEKTDAE